MPLKRLSERSGLKDRPIIRRSETGKLMRGIITRVARTAGSFDTIDLRGAGIQEEEATCWSHLGTTSVIVIEVMSETDDRIVYRGANSIGVIFLQQYDLPNEFPEDV